MSQIIQRPALTGHIGEYIASKVFNIELCRSATTKSIDGIFVSGQLKDKSVNVKLYEKMEGLLDINKGDQPDFYLVLAWPRVPAVPSKGQTRPIVISCAFLHESKFLLNDLTNRGGNIGTATSVALHIWDAAEIFPDPRCRFFSISQEQRALLELFNFHY